MPRPRVIPVLLLRDEGLVKTFQFKNPKYLGDPRNTVRIFNEKEVDELVLLDIKASIENKRPMFDLIQEIVSEAFMPVAYGGGIRSLDDIRMLFTLGIEKVIINTSAVENPSIIGEAAALFGSQSIVVCIDVKRTIFGGIEVFTHSGSRRSRWILGDLLREIEKYGVGEIIIQSIDRDGAQGGYDLEIVRLTANAVSVPVIACGGAGSLEHMRDAIAAGASAVAAGSLFVFHGKLKAVLISYPDYDQLKEAFNEA